MSSDKRMGSSPDAGPLLERLRSGDGSAAAELLPLVYDQLRALASSYMRGERREHTLQPTALVHEAYMRLVRSPPPDLQGRSHFIALAARAMRQVLVEHARGKGRTKRGGDWQRVSFNDGAPAVDPKLGDVDLLALNQALERLGKLSERQARIVELRYFGGLTVPEVAETLGLGRTTVQDDWGHARAFLYRELTRS